MGGGDIYFTRYDDLKCPLAVKEHLFSKEPKQSQINSMIEYQIEAIFAALRAIPKKFTS